MTAIGDYSFAGCTELLEITLPTTLSSIGIYSFDGCSSLASVTIPSGVETISLRAFRGCTSLLSITLPKSVTVIALGAFEGCESLASVNYGGSEEDFGEVDIDIHNSALDGATITFAEVTEPPKEDYTGEWDGEL